MRLPGVAHEARRWRVREITGDFRVEDVWALPVGGRADDFPSLAELIASHAAIARTSRVVRMLYGVRLRLGALLGWDGANDGVGARVPSLRDRLPPDLRAARGGPDLHGIPFRSLYLLDDEWAAELANRTMHGVLHVGWVPDGRGRYRGQMAVLVKPNGVLGSAYMAAIRPFRHFIVYPALLRELEHAWETRTRERCRASHAHDGKGS